MSDIYSNDDIKRQLDNIEIKLHRMESMVDVVVFLIVAFITFAVLKLIFG